MSTDASRTEDAAALLSAVMVLVRTSRAVGHRRTQALGPSGTPYAVLKTLSQGETRAGDLATALAVSPSVISRALVPLEQAGLIERRPDTDDARAWRLTLSDLGRATLAGQHAEHVRLFVGAIADWDDDELRAATDALTRIEQVIATHAESFRTAHRPLRIPALREEGAQPGRSEQPALSDPPEASDPPEPLRQRATA